MTPILIDIGFVVLTVIFAIHGWRQGFVRMGGSLIALAVSVVIATWGVAWLEETTGWHFSGNPVIFVLVFLFITLVLTKLMGLAISLVDLVRKIFSIIPGVSMTNNILGFCVGLIEAGMVVLALSFATVNFFPQSALRDALVESLTIGTGVNILVNLSVL